MTASEAAATTLLRAIRAELLPTVLAIALVALYALLLVRDGAAPDGLETLIVMVVAFYFGTRNGQRLKQGE